MFCFNKKEKRDFAPPKGPNISSNIFSFVEKSNYEA